MQNGNILKIRIKLAWRKTNLLAKTINLRRARKWQQVLSKQGIQIRNYIWIDQMWRVTAFVKVRKKTKAVTVWGN